MRVDRRRPARRPHADRVPAAGRRWPGSPAASSRGPSCSTRSTASHSSRTSARSTPTSRTSAARSSPIRTRRATCRPCSASGYRFAEPAVARRCPTTGRPRRRWRANAGPPSRRGVRWPPWWPDARTWPPTGGIVARPGLAQWRIGEHGPRRWHAAMAAAASCAAIGCFCRCGLIVLSASSGALGVWARRDASAGLVATSAIGRVVAIAGVVLSGSC